MSAACRPAATSSGGCEVRSSSTGCGSPKRALMRSATSITAARSAWYSGTLPRRGRGPLHEARLVAPALVPQQQQPLERLEALGDALGVVEPVDAEQDQALVALAREGIRAVGGGELAEAMRVDADGVGGDVLAVRGGQQRAQLIAVARRLRADQLVGGERGGEVLVVRDRLPVLARRDRHVVEVAERTAPAEPLQLAAERDQLVVMHPDQVVGAQQRDQRQREAAVRGQVGRVLEMAARRLIGETVQVRPERAVAEALVVVGDLPRGQVDGDVVDVARDGALRRRVRVAGLPAPAEPEATDGGERRQQRGDEAARGARARPRQAGAAPGSRR